MLHIRGSLLFSIWRRYKFESNSQQPSSLCFWCIVVFNMTKIQVRKQFTTVILLDPSGVRLFSIWRRYKFESNSQRDILSSIDSPCCFQYDEDTSSKAIHNKVLGIYFFAKVVFNMTKIQVRKQFTTGTSLYLTIARCFQYDEDTSSKAIHNHFNI